MSCKRVTKGVAARVFYNASLTHSRFYSLLQNALVNMMPSLLAGLFVYPAVFLGEEPQLAEFFCHLLRAFSHTVTKLNRTPAVGKVFVVNNLYFLNMLLKLWNKAFWEHYTAVFSALP